MIRVYPVTPVPAPRQTRRDALRATSRFPVRAPVARYRAYGEELRLRGVLIPQPFYHVIFVLPMPAGWSASEKAEKRGMPHQQKPDKDNLEKALLDSLFGDDSHVWDARATKLWGDIGLLIVSEQPITITLPFDLTAYYEAARTRPTI